MFWISITGIMLTVAAAPVDVILDTDLGSDIDDTWALLQMLGTPELNPKLIVTAAHNTPLKTRLVAKILEAVGRADVPLGTGKKTADKSINQEAWLDNYSLDNYPGVVHEDGVQVMIDMVMAAERPITICAIGPVTNLGEALRREPAIADKARVVLMAGSIHIGYGGNPEPCPEWNVRCDVDAFKAVFAAPWDITIAPLDSCGTLQLQGDDYRKVAQSEAAAAQTVIANYNAWKNRRHYAEDSTSVLFDTVAIYLAHGVSGISEGISGTVPSRSARLEGISEGISGTVPSRSARLEGISEGISGGISGTVPSRSARLGQSLKCPLLELETLPLVVTDDGMTVIDEAKGRPVHCALRWKDEAAFKAHLIETITR